MDQDLQSFFALATDALTEKTAAKAIALAGIGAGIALLRLA